jgi:hypothetical protein
MRTVLHCTLALAMAFSTSVRAAAKPDGPLSAAEIRACLKGRPHFSNYRLQSTPASPYKHFKEVDGKEIHNFLLVYDDGTMRSGWDDFADGYLYQSTDIKTHEAMAIAVRRIGGIVYFGTDATKSC